MSGLFRPEVAEQRRNRLMGDVLLAVPLPSRVIAGLLIALVAILALTAAFGSFAAYETVPGRLTPSRGLITVASSRSGALVRLDVQEGDRVVARQAIGLLQTIGPTPAGGIEAALSREAGAAQLTEAAQSRQLATTEAQRRSRLAFLRRELRELEHRLQNQMQQVDLAESQLSRARELADFPPRKLSELPRLPRALTAMTPVARVRTRRRALGLTQEAFALRYHIPFGTLRDWEQGRSQPDQPARAYLAVIARDPEHVRKALEREGL